MAYNKTEDDKGRQAVPIIGNESANGTGVSHRIVSDSNGYLKVSLQTLADDTKLVFGDVASLQWQTDDANANALALLLPEGGATDVPVFVIGDGTAEKDLGWFNGVTEPRVAVVDDAGTSAIALGFNGAADAQILLYGSAALTLPALTLSGTVAAGNQNIANVGRASFANTNISAEVYAYMEANDTVTDNGSKYGILFQQKAQKTNATYTGLVQNKFVVGVGSTNTQHWTRSPVGLAAVVGTTGTTAASATTVTGAAVFLADNLNMGTNITFTNGYSVYVANASGAGTLTNQYGLYIEDMTEGTTLNYAIKLNGGAVDLSLPASDPSVAGQLWANSGVVTVSAG